MSRYRLIAAAACGILLAASLAGLAGEEAGGVADVLAKMPAKTMADGQALATEILKLGPAAVKDVCSRVLPPGKEDDSKARFAIGGMAFYVSRPGAEAERKVFAGALAEVLEAETRPEVKNFLVAMLQLVGKDEAVAPLGKLLADEKQGFWATPSTEGGAAAVKLLGDEKLCAPAARALVAIGTPEAAAALAQALPKSTGACRVAIIQAIATLRVKAAVPALIPLAGDADPDTRREALFALATIGDPSAAEVLAKAADAQAPYDRSYATARYLLFAQRLAEAGQKADCAKICRELIKSRTAPRENNVVASALKTLVRAVGEDALPDVLGAVDSPNLQLREAALQLAEAIPGEAATAKWVERAKQAPPAQRAEILAMLARRGDKSALPAGLDALAGADAAVRLAGVKAVARLGVPEAAAAVLAKIAADDKEPSVRAAAIKALGELASGQSVALLIPLLLNAQDPGEQAALQRAVVAACGRILEPEKRADALLAAHPAAAGPKRASLLRAMTGVGGPKALAAVLADTKDADAVVRDAAVRALAEWPDDGAAAPLLAMARGSEKQTEQVLALRGYIRLAGSSQKRPEAQTLGMFKSALDAAKRPEEKRLAIAGLAGVRSIESLKLVAPFLDDPALEAEAALAAVKIACPQGSEKGLAGPEIAPTLQKAVPLIKDANVRKQADAYLKGIIRNP